MVGRVVRFAFGLVALFWTAALPAQETSESNKWMLEVSYTGNVSYFEVSGGDAESGASSQRPENGQTLAAYADHTPGNSAPESVWANFS